MIFNMQLSEDASLAELSDIRVGVDGTVYPSAGDAVRGQITDVKEDINALISESSGEVVIPIIGNPIVQGSFNSAGEVTPSTSRIRTKNFIYVPKNGSITFTSGAKAKQICIAYWHLDGTYINYTAYMNDGASVTFDDDYKILVLWRVSGNNETIVPSDYDAITTIHAAWKNSDTSIIGTVNFSNNILGFNWLPGYITTTGSYSSGGTDRVCTVFIPCRPNIEIKYVAETNHSSICGIAFYQNDETFISGFSNNGSMGSECTVTSPSKTAYMRVSTKVAILDKTYVKFTLNSASVMVWLQRQITNATIYVDGVNGNDSTGYGTKGNPYKTISRALTYGYSNISVCVSPGVYNEKVSASFMEGVHIYAGEVTFASSVPNRPKVIIDGGSTIDTPLELQYIRNLKLDDIVVQNSAASKNGCLINHCNKIELHNCEFKNNGFNGVKIDYSNGVIRDCKADYNGNDGFNMNYYGDTQFFNCSGHHNVDDGISHHQGTTGCINGGEWHNNGQGGVASPAHGSQVDLLNFYSHNNAYGVFANCDSDAEARIFRMWNCVLTDNHVTEHSPNGGYGLTCKRNTCIAYNCKISGNDHQTTAPSGGQIIIL